MEVLKMTQLKQEFQSRISSFFIFSSVQFCYTWHNQWAKSIGYKQTFSLRIKFYIYFTIELLYYLTGYNNLNIILYFILDFKLIFYACVSYYICLLDRQNIPDAIDSEELICSCTIWAVHSFGILVQTLQSSHHWKRNSSNNLTFAIRNVQLWMVSLSTVSEIPYRGSNYRTTRRTIYRSNCYCRLTCITDVYSLLILRSCGATICPRCCNALHFVVLLRLLLISRRLQLRSLSRTHLQCSSSRGYSSFLNV